jgi:hypothetical protein
MRRLIAVGITLVVVGCMPSAASAVLPTIHNTLIVPGGSIGGITVGASLQEVNATWGGNCVSSVECVWDGKRQGCAQIAMTNPQTQLDIEHLGAGRVKTIVLDYLTHVGHNPTYKTPLARFRTAKGIGIGSSINSLLKAYPHAKRVHYPEMQGPGRVYYVLGLGLRYCGFLTHNGRVAWIALGVLANEVRHAC